LLSSVSTDWHMPPTRPHRVVQPVADGGHVSATHFSKMTFSLQWGTIRSSLAPTLSMRGLPNKTKPKMNPHTLTNRRSDIQLVPTTGSRGVHQEVYEDVGLGDLLSGKATQSMRLRRVGRNGGVGARKLMSVSKRHVQSEQTNTIRRDQSPTWPSSPICRPVLR
jgi:hypothetical protein